MLVQRYRKPCKAYTLALQHGCNWTMNVRLHFNWRGRMCACVYCIPFALTQRMSCADIVCLCANTARATAELEMLNASHSPTSTLTHPCLCVLLCLHLHMRFHG